MYVRLAFAVAAHLSPDILIVDEVLAVGDVAFQRKCLAKMEDVRESGRTIVFVSHNMAAVSRLCQRALLIADGVVQKEGSVADVTSAYLFSSFNTSAHRAWPDPSVAPGSTIVRLRSVRVRSEDGVTTETVDIRQPVGIEIVYDVLVPGHVLIPYVDFVDETAFAFSCRKTSIRPGGGGRDPSVPSRARRGCLAIFFPRAACSSELPCSPPIPMLSTFKRATVWVCMSLTAGTGMLHGATGTGRCGELFARS